MNGTGPFGCIASSLWLYLHIDPRAQNPLTKAGISTGRRANT
jgi:hypothetical protein